MAANAQQIMDLEKRFWQSMIDKDAKLAGTMIAEESLVIGPMGLMKIDPAKYEAMTKEGDWTLDSFDFEEVEVVFPSVDVAAIAYKVHQKGSMKGKPMDMHCADCSTWVRSGDAWKCALHAEVMLGN